MNQMCRKFEVLRCLLLVILLFVGGFSCVGIEKGSNVDRAERLRERVSGFLEARNKSNLEEMRQFYLEPGQARVGNVMIRDGKIVSLEIEEGELKAKVKITASMVAMGFTFKNVPRTQAWIWENGDWYIDPLGAVSGNPFTSKKGPKVEDEKPEK